MFGIGSAMMRYIMKAKGIDSLESLRHKRWIMVLSLSHVKCRWM